jgi:outer membrane receptor protein involved in Fe transport
MIEAPHFTGNAALRKSFSSGLGDFTLNAGVVYHSTAFVSADNRLTFPAYALVNGSMDWTEHGGRYGVRLWAKNLTGRTYYDARFETGVGDLQIQAAPREYGIEGHVIL